MSFVGWSDALSIATFLEKDGAHLCGAKRKLSRELEVWKTHDGAHLLKSGDVTHVIDFVASETVEDFKSTPR